MSVGARPTSGPYYGRRRWAPGSKRVLGVIDHFGSGGAQRQLVELMLGLAERGHRVELFIYYPSFDFFRQRLDRAGITIHACESAGAGVRAVVAFRKLVRRLRPDTVVAFLEGPSVLAELGRAGVRVPRVIVSERSSRHGDHGAVRRLGLRLLHALADVVVANSEDHAAWLKSRFPWLRRKVRCIYNGVSAEFEQVAPPPPPDGDLRLLAVGRVDHGKNPMVLARACALHVARHGWAPCVVWAGRAGENGGSAVRDAVDQFLARNPAVAARWRWLGESGDIPQLLGDSHALVHPSLYEGLPNAVCEALAAGRPVIASAVGDAARLVGAPGERGFLFAPHADRELLGAIESLASIRGVDWESLTMRCRQYAATTLNIERMVDRYEELLVE